MHRHTATAAVLTLALVAAACGSDDRGGGEDKAAGNKTTSTTHDHNAMQAAERGETPTSVDPEDRCDLGLNTAEFNNSTVLVEALHTHSSAMQAEAIDFTVQEWAEVFTDPALGLSPAEVVAQVESNPGVLDTLVSGGFAHTLDPDSWVPMTDAAQCEALASELQRARDAAARYPTLADALAAGYTPGSLYAPGLGAHYTNVDAIVRDGFNPDVPEQLMYDHPSDPAAHLMGMSYYVIAPEGLLPEHGFTGDSDKWHGHDTLCLNAEGVAGPKTECDAGRGTLVSGVGGWMLHAWVVPGCESRWGMFSGANPQLSFIPSGVLPASGCNSGKTVADPLELDDTGDGPRLR